MINFKNKKIKRLTFLFILILILIVPVFASNSKNKDVDLKIKTEENKKIKSSNFSSWAIKDLNEAKFFGIFPTERFLDGTNFKKTITIEDANNIYLLSKNKLEDKDINTKGDFEFKDLTRIEILNSISKLLNEDEIKLKNLQDNKIFLGSSDEKYLNSKISLEEMLALYARAVNSKIQRENKTSKGYFYEIKNKDNTIYMLGSIHLGKSEMYPIDRRIIDSLKKSKEIYMEVDLTNAEEIKKMKEKMYYQDNTTLKEDLGDELYSRVIKVIENFGIEDNLISKMKPWALYNLISIDPKNDVASSDFGVEYYFLSQSLINGVKINELESIAMQTEILSNFDKKSYISMIKDLVCEIEKNGYENINNDLNKMLDSWIKGDDSYIKQSFNTNKKDNTDKFNIALVDKRDLYMADKIEKLLKKDGKNTYFILVGAAHLVPYNSITGILKDRGYDIIKN